VAHPCHEFPGVRARIGRELVAGMAQVVNVDALQADSAVVRRGGERVGGLRWVRPPWLTELKILRKRPGNR
jgi:hypothetical protein